jgi:YD repeat-containing protein
VTTAEFDANGNCTKSIKTGHYAVSNFQVEIDGAYNSRGQLTAVTNAADANGYRPVTRLEYGSNAFPTTVVFDADASGLKITNSADYTPVGVLSRRIDPLGNDWLYTYNALDQLIRAESPTNVAARSKVDFLYDANGNVSSTIEELRDDTDAFVRNVVTSYEYNSLDECTAMIEQVSPGVTITNKFFRNGIGELIRVESPLAASGVDPYAAVEFQYDERGLLFREIEAPGGGSSGTNEWSYTAAYHPATKKYVDATASLTTTFAYDGFAGSSVGQPIKLPMLSGCLEGIDIAAKGSRPIEFPMLETCPDGISRAAGNGRISSITDPMGNVTTFNYDANSNLKLVRHYGQTNDVPGTNGNTLLAQSSYAYDGLDRLVTQHDAHFDIVGQTIGDGYRTTSFTYAPNGARTSVTDDLGRTTSFYYDTAGRGTNVTSPGQRTSFAILLDGGGRPVKCTQTDRSDLPGPLQVFARTNVFDSLGRCVQTVDNVGNTNRVFLDSFSRVVKASDAKNNFSFGEYDDLGRSQKWTINLNPSGSPDPDGVQTTYSYDANSRLVSMTDDNTNTTYVAYDSLNHPTQLTLADGTHRTLVWSPRSNLILQQDANGTVISNSFDALNRCVRRDITPGAGVANTTTFTSYAYDGLSRVVAATNNAAYRTIQRDSLGWPAKWSLSELDASKVHDSEGNCLSMTYPSGRIVSYAYNSLNQVTNVSSSPGIGQPFTSLASLDYDGPGRIARISRANGINTRISWNGLAGVANAQGDFGWGQISGINHQVAGGGAIIDRRVMSYDRNQNKTSRKQTAPFAVGQPMLTNLWSHDALDRVAYSFAGKPMMIEDTYEFTLDGNGNRQVVTSNGVAQLYSMDATPPPGPADFQVNQYTITPFASQTYDENGNMLSRSSTAQQLMYEYDFADRLVSVADVTSGSAVPVADYAYGPFGERVSKTVYSTSPIIPPTTTTYVYAKSKESCGNGIIDPGEGCDDSVLEIRVNGALIDSYINVVDDRGLLGLREHNGAIQHYILDDLGNTLALADSGGGVIERFDYGDFGEPRFLNAIGLPTGTNSSSAGNPFLFLGMEWDSETGLYSLKLKTKLGGTFDKIKNNPILRQRAPASGGYYDPQTGRDNSGGNSTRAGISTSRSNIRQKNGFFSGSDDPNAAKVPRAILKTFFQTGDKPTQAEVKVLPLTYPAKTGKTGKTK